MVGFSNYIRLFTVDPYFLKSVANTVLLMLMYLPAGICLGLIFASIVYSPNVKGRRLFQIANFMPNITTPVAVGLLFAMLFDWKTGMVNRVLIALGVSQTGFDYLGSPWGARIVVAGMVLWKSVGYCMTVYLAGLAGIPRTLYEAAELDGASAHQQFFYVTIPQIKDISLFLIITGTISGFSLLDEPMLLLSGWATTGGVVGGPMRSCLTSMWYLYDTAYGTTMHYGLAAAISYGLFLFIGVFSYFSVKMMYRGEKLI